MAYSGKYKGSEIDSLLDRVASGDIGGGSGKKIVVIREHNRDIITLNPNEIVVLAENDPMDVEIGELTHPEYDENKEPEEQGECYYAEYTVVFRASNVTTIILPSDWLWPNGEFDGFGYLDELETGEAVEFELSISFRGSTPNEGYYKAVIVPFKLGY